MLSESADRWTPVCPQVSRRTVGDTEKFAYLSGNHFPLVLFGALSGLLLLIGLCRFAVVESLLWIAVPFVMVNGCYLVLSYGVMFAPGTYSRREHQARMARWQGEASSLKEICVDVFLPVCGEPWDVIQETWNAVRALRWPGKLQIVVLDDSPDDPLRERALVYGFQYLKREDRTFQKAGNLRYGFQKTNGKFILLLDADFCPRPEMLLELVPWLLEDDQRAIVQTPQYFDVAPAMNWIQAGAGFVQELFYRLIQPARDRFGASVCVGSCAVYRRAALAELNGAPEIDHSEDLWTGFELLHRGWSIKYVPVIYAKGLCPATLDAFFRQQSRWCQGSLSLVLSSRFWNSTLTWSQKICFIAGFSYYLATSMNCLLAPLPPVVMVCLFPDWVHWNHLAFSILALIYTPFILGWWSTYSLGFHFLTTREVSGAAHLDALLSHVLGRARCWIPTGSHSRNEGRSPWKGAFLALLAASALGGLLVWTGAIIAISLAPNRWVHFLPPLLFSTLHLAICWRALEGLPLRWHRRPTASAVRSDVPPAGCKLHWGQVLVPLFVLLGCSSWIIARPLAARNDIFSQNATSGEDLLSPSTESLRFNLAPDADFGPYVVTNAFPGVNLQRIVRMREHPTHAGTFFLADYTGRIHQLDFQNEKWNAKLVVDLTRQQSHQEAIGDLAFLYSFEIHPHYPADPRFFLTYHTAQQGIPQSWRVTSIPVHEEQCAGLMDEQLLIEQAIDNTEHMGGDLAFDDQGCLLISCGDHERSLNDHRSQQLGRSFDSGILRIDIDRRGKTFSHSPKRMPEQTWTANYFIPNDNPFVGRAGVLEEFWALGLRNPFRIFFDFSRRDLWIGDVGQDRLEQVEVARAGTNHQWSFQEGTLPFEKSYLNGIPPAPLLGISTPPHYEYPHEDLNACIVGGILYQGDRFPELSGKYIFGDNRSGRIWSIDPRYPRERAFLLQLPFGKKSSTLVSISSDRAGEIYFTSFVSTPTVLRLTRSRPMGFPEWLSEADIFAEITTQAPASGVLPYEVTVPLWSDGMTKRRWIRLPPGTSIDNRSLPWKFPPGTLFIKHFEQGADFASPGRPVETRLLLVRADGSTAGASYLWNTSATDARLQKGRLSLEMSAGAETFLYQIPSVQDCKVCHHRDNDVLGFVPEQLHRFRTSAPESQLAWLSRWNCFFRPYRSDEHVSVTSLSALDDSEAPLERRARSYLHANCGFCHHQDGLEHVRMDLDFFSDSSSLLNAPAQLHYHQIDGRYSRFLIAPGNLAESAIYQRLKTKDRRFAMPYLGRSRPDPEALRVLSDWILSLSASSPRLSIPRSNEETSHAAR